MSEPAKLTDRERQWVAQVDEGMHPPFAHAVRAASARLDWLEPEADRLRAELATAHNLLGRIARDDEQGLMDLGAARQREADAMVCENVLGLTASTLPGRQIFADEIASRIRATGSCLPPLPDEAELARLRQENADLLEAYNNTAG